MKSVYLIILLLLPCFVFSQTSDISDIGSVVSVPPSPNAASLGKYGQIPVSKYTGVPNIEIPLYTIQVDDITVPISLSFHASGYKTGDNASWTGYGWSLNAGGVVGRNMKGTPDENGYFKVINKFLDWKDNGMIAMLGVVYNSSIHSPEELLVKEEMVEIITQGEGEYEADLFYYNYPGGAGKFQFAPDKNIIQFPYKDYKIEVDMNASDYTSGGEIYSFKIHDTSGKRYNFDINETSTSHLLGEAVQDEYNSSWYLSSVYSKVSNQSVSFTYSEVLPITTLLEPSEKYVISFDNIQSQVSSTSSQMVNNVHTRYLESITWADGIVHFYKSGNRLDLTGGQQLDSLEVRNNDGAIVKKYIFEYDYFANNRHLKLVSLSEVSSDGRSLPPYRFEYYSGIPNRNTKATDHFGYYNGRDNNTTMVPYFVNQFSVKKNLADREVYKDEAIVGMLKKMNYPTGGYTEFEYESNYYNGTSYEDKNYKWVAEFCDENGALYIDPVTGNTIEGIGCQSSVEQDFIVEDIETYDGFYLMLKASGNSSMQIQPGDFVAEILEKNGTDYTRISYYDVLDTEYHSYKMLEMAGKEYKIKLKSKIKNSSLVASLYYKVKNSGNVLGPGIRVASITHYKDKGDTQYARRLHYSYNKDLVSNVSSGVYTGRYPEYITRYSDFSDISEAAKFTITSESNPIGLIGSLDGEPVVYEQVLEYEEGIGGIRDFFSIYPELRQIGENLPNRAEPSSSFWKRGHKLKEIVYNEEGDILSENHFFYSFHDIDTNVTFVAQPEVYHQPKYFLGKWAFNEQVSGWARLDSTTKILNSNFHTQKSKQAFTYNEELISPVRIDNLMGNKLDYSMVNAYMNDRINYIIDPILEKQLFNDENDLIRKEVNIYTNHKLDQRSLFATDGILIGSAQYTYDNGLKVQKEEISNGQVTEYIWAYDGKRPIVKAVNPPENFQTIAKDLSLLPAGYASLEQLMRSLGEISTDQQAKARWKEYNDALRDHPDNAGAMIYTYTYVPLIGITSETDPAGYTRYYEYDSFGRLILIKDQEDNVVEHYRYHFGNDSDR